MKYYYQVSVSFSLSGCKPQLVKMSLNTTTEYIPFLSYSTISPLFINRFFRKLSQAQEYVSYLFSRYPNSTATRPVLDAQQFILF